MKSISNQVFASIILSSSLIFGGWLYYRIQRIVAYETKKDYEIHVRNAEQIANYLSYPMEIQNKSVIDDNLQNEVSDKYINAVKVFMLLESYMLALLIIPKIYTPNRQKKKT